MASRAFTADLLQASSAGLARVASEQLLNELGDAELYGADPAVMWRDHISAQIQELAVALASDQPSLFVDQVSWNKAAFSSRKVPVDDLYRSLTCLRDALRSELPPEAGEPAADVIQEALESWDSLSGVAPSRLDAVPQEAARVSRDYLQALLGGRRREACESVLGVVREGRLAARDAILDICLPVEAELGRLWHLDQISIAQEHFVTATTTRLMGQIADLSPASDPHGRVVVCAALEADDHNVGLTGVSLLFELDGWETRDLGRNVPVEELATAALGFGADLVAVSATLGVHVPAVAEAISNLRAREAQEKRAVIPVLVGGPAFREGSRSWSGLAADGIVFSARDAVAKGRELIGLPVDRDD